MGSIKTTQHRLDSSEFDESIQTGIPIPKRTSGAVSKYRSRMERLAVGQSFFVAHGTQPGAVKMARKVGINIETRKYGQGIRIWRIA